MSLCAKIDSMTDEQKRELVDALSARAGACSRSRRFDTPSAACRAASAESVEVFRCEVCGKWHVRRK